MLSVLTPPTEPSTSLMKVPATAPLSGPLLNELVELNFSNAVVFEAVSAGRLGAPESVNTWFQSWQPVSAIAAPWSSKFVPVSLVPNVVPEHVGARRVSSPSSFGRNFSRSPFFFLSLRRAAPNNSAKRDEERGL